MLQYTSAASSPAEVKKLSRCVGISVPFVIRVGMWGGSNMCMSCAASVSRSGSACSKYLGVSSYVFSGSFQISEW